MANTSARLPHSLLVAHREALSEVALDRAARIYLLVYILTGICLEVHTSAMAWSVEVADEFEPEFATLAPEVQEEIAALVRLLQQFGPTLGRPHCDTLKGSRHSNMKELRFSAADGVWRVAFAFDPKRRAILLVAGDKSGTSEARFYKTLIRGADQRFARHLKELKEK